MLPFSAGPRKCIGEFFARVQMQIHLMMIAKQLRLRCVGGKPVELEAGVNLRSKHDFIMTPEINPLAGHCWRANGAETPLDARSRGVWADCPGNDGDIAGAGQM